MAYGVVYLLTNVVNGRFYVGQTIQDPECRFRQHITDARRKSGPLQYALRKYGAESFCLGFIGEANSLDELNKLESIWISVLGATRRGVGYNCRTGGDSQIPNEETRAKLSVAHMGQVRTAEQKARAANSNRGRKRSPESLANLREGARKRSEAMPLEQRTALAERMRHMVSGRSPWNKGVKGVQVAWNKGVPVTEEVRARLQSCRVGRKMTDSAKAKISAALKGRMPVVNQRRQALKAATAA